MEYRLKFFISIQQLFRYLFANNQREGNALCNSDVKSLQIKSSPDVTVAISSTSISPAINLRKMKAEEPAIAAFVRIAKVPGWG